MPVRVFKAEKLVLKQSENRRGDDRHGNGPAHDRGSLLSDLWITRQNAHRPSRQDEANDDRTDGGAAMVAECKGAEERGCTAPTPHLDDSQVPKQTKHPES